MHWFPTDNGYFNLLWEAIREETPVAQSFKTKIHVAGPMIDLVQECARCGKVLTDYRNTMVPAEEGGRPLTGWAEGAHVEVSEGNPRYSSTTDDEPTCVPQS